MNLLNRPFMATMALSLVLLSSCDEKKAPRPTLPNTSLYAKDLTIQLYTEMDYSESRWADPKMKVNLKLLRRSTTLPKDEVLLDTVIGWIPFQELPRKSNPINVHKLLRNVHKEQDALLLDVTKVVSVSEYETATNYNQPLDHAKQEEIVEVKL